MRSSLSALQTAPVRHVFQNILDKKCKTVSLLTIHFLFPHLKEAMKKTFADHRVLLVKKKVWLAALKRLYPALFTEEEVSSGRR